MEKVTGRSRIEQEPFPWFLIALISLAAAALVATSATRILRFHAVESAREQRWRIEHDAMLRQTAELAAGGGCESATNAKVKGELEGIVVTNLELHGRR